MTFIRSRGGHSGKVFLFFCSISYDSYHNLMNRYKEALNVITLCQRYILELKKDENELAFKDLEDFIEQMDNFPSDYIVQVKYVDKPDPAWMDNEELCGKFPKNGGEKLLYISMS